MRFCLHNKHKQEKLKQEKRRYFFIDSVFFKKLFSFIKVYNTFLAI